MDQKKRGVVCLPADTVVNGLHMTDRGEVNVALAKEQHSLYRQALRDFGYSLITMPENNSHPDSVFVEDPAIIVKNRLIGARLASAERRGEEALLLSALKPFFGHVNCVEEPAHIEGGDVLVTERIIYVGLSLRTNEAGAETLTKIVYDAFRMPTYCFRIPENFLHLKGEATFHRSCGMITASEEIARHFADSGYKIIATPQEERFGGNCISDGDRILVHAGRTKTKRILEKSGFRTQEIDISEFEKIDGAMTCLSKLWVENR